MSISIPAAWRQRELMSTVILVADNETHIVNGIAARLRAAGFKVLTAADGAEAYAIAMTARPDLVIADFQMPRLSGLELACKLARDPMTCEIPVLLLAARGLSLPRNQQSRPNIRGILAKPFTPRQMLACVQDALCQGC